jgi:hypothetical protein
MGTWLGLVALYYLGAGVPVGMQILTLFSYLPLTAFILYRGTCICETVTAPVTFTNNWINILPSFSKLENGLFPIFGGAGRQGLQ